MQVARMGGKKQREGVGMGPCVLTPWMPYPRTVVPNLFQMTPSSVENLLKDVQLTGDAVLKIQDVFLTELENGIHEKPSSLQMENTYIPELPDGTEEGLFLALDLGGTNFRVILLELYQGSVVREEVKHYHIREEQRLGCGEKLFDFLADSVSDFVRGQKLTGTRLPLGVYCSSEYKLTGTRLPLGVYCSSEYKLTGTRLPLGVYCSSEYKLTGTRLPLGVYCSSEYKLTGTRLPLGVYFSSEYKLTGTRLPLGFTFSFPMIQKALNIGLLVTWTKSFNCPSVVGRDAVNMLQEAINRRTLVQGAVLDPRTTIGLILGTGSNACYLERADRVQHWEQQRHGEKQVIIDIEWGAFGDNGTLDFIKTDFDRTVDKNSLIANSFMFEKYIGGKYMGEIVRVILVRLTKDCLLFGGETSDTLLTSGTFTTSFVSIIEQDTIDDTSENTVEILHKLGLSCDEDDVAIVKYVCEVVSNRAALLVSVCLSTLLSRQDRPDVTIAVDGSLYKYHPRLKGWMNKYIKLLAPGRKFQMLLAEDGSGKGAGLVAAIALKLRKRLQDS
uniref:Phosphotransferase n=1 Tax=Timema monikensis TaxID=170555 RepID=A0A7R9HQF9_9NEOP|nr:unnamed protein product [Timema monikensis]